MNYFVLTTQATKDGGLIEMYPKGAPTGWKFHEGMSLLEDFPKDAWVQFSDNFPDARKLYDFQTNTLDALIISGRVRKLLEALEVANAEYLPVVVRDHKRQEIGKDYAILNLQGGEDAIDMEKSEYKMNPMDEDQIGRILKLVLNEKGIRPGMKLFRCSKMPRLILLREDVHEAFQKEGLTGYKTYKAEGWNGLEL